MKRASGHQLLALLVAIAGTGAVYRLVRDVGLAAATGLTWGGTLLVLLRIKRTYPAHLTGTAWDDKRWTGFGVGLVTLAGLVGVSPTLPLSSELRLGLGLLVLGAGSIGYVTGTMAELERETD